MAAKIGRAALVQRQRASRITTQPQTLPPPLKGWNARDPYEQMDPQEAVQLDNWYPDYQGCLSRDGCQPFADTNKTQPVATLAVWRQGASSALVAACAGFLFDVSAGSGVPTSLGSGYHSDWYAWANYNGYLFLCNGQDGILQWQGPSGPAVVASGFTIDTATSGFPATTINEMIGVAVRHNRLFFWTGRDAGFWYGPLLGIAGSLEYFDFSQSVPDGAAVIGIDVLTYDGGTGIADYTVFILSTGEVLTYSGTDPTNPNNWALVGLYVLAAPVGGAEVSGAVQIYPNRGYLRYGGDIYIVTSSDHTKLSQLLIALKLGQMPPRSKVSQAVIDAVNLGGRLPGWQVVFWGKKRRILINVPAPDGSYTQHVYNPALDAWARYTGLPAVTWGVWNDRLFFGTPNGWVVEHGVGSVDQFTTSGAVNPISMAGWQAPNLFGTPLGKRVAAVRGIVQSSGGDVTAKLGLGFDYLAPSIIVNIIDTVAQETPWGSPWGSPWSDETAVDPQWSVAGGEGSAISVQLSAQSPRALIWVRTDLRIEPGSAL